MIAYGLRMRVMGLLGISTERLAMQVRSRATRLEQQARDERIGFDADVIDRIRARAMEVDQIAGKVQAS